MAKTKPTKKPIQLIVGSVYNCLTVVGGPLYHPTSGRRVFIFKCVCGKEVLQLPHRVVIEKRVKSCGCQQKFQKGNYRHGHSPASGTTAEYRAFNNAKNRCTDPKSEYYRLYGGRGIEFRFESFTDFIEHIGIKPTKRHTLDRIDVNGHYEPGNIRWATPKEQASNTRRNKFITIDGITDTQSGWARTAGIADRTINDRIKRGYCLRCAIFAPPEMRWGKPCDHTDGPKDKVWRLKNH